MDRSKSAELKFSFGLIKFPLGYPLSLILRKILPYSEGPIVVDGMAVGRNTKSREDDGDKCK